MQHSEQVYVKKVRGKGRGVFARCPIRKGAVIEKVPVLLVPAKYINDGMSHPGLVNFFYIRNRTTLAVALGYGSLYNHSYRPNARYDDDPAAAMVYTAIRDIAPDEEITVNYNGDPKDKSPVGFDVVE